MKSIRLALFLAVMAFVLTSCGFFSPVMPMNTKTYYYFLHISFKDKAGNELVAPLAADQFMSVPSSVWFGEIDTLKYSLSIVMSNPGSSEDTKSYYLPPLRVSSQASAGWNTRRPSVTLTKFDDQLVMVQSLSDGSFPDEGKWYMDFHYSVATNTSNQQEYLIYKFSCPTVFGDKSVHDIKAFWGKGDEKSYLEIYPACTKVVLDGKEYTAYKGVTYLDNNGSAYTSYFVEIVLDR